MIGYVLQGASILISISKRYQENVRGNIFMRFQACSSKIYAKVIPKKCLFARFKIFKLIK